MTDDKQLKLIRQFRVKKDKNTNTLLATIDRQQQEIERLLDAFTEIREYWNRDENERAMSDALHAIDDICNRALGE